MARMAGGKQPADTDVDFVLKKVLMGLFVVV